MSPLDLINWTIAIFFPITTFLTCVGLLKEDFIREKYFKKLFRIVMLELIAAAFYLFYDGVNGKEVSFVPPAVPGDLVVFNRHSGEPLQPTEVLLGNRKLLEFNRGEDVGLDAEREFQLVEDRLLVTTNGEVRSLLGFINRSALVGRIGSDIVTARQHLGLGMYYAVEIGSERRDPDLAVEHLLTVLRRSGSAATHRPATRQLFHLRKWLASCEGFESLVDGTRRYVEEPNKYKELGDIYASMSTQLPGLDQEIIVKLSRAAVWNFTRYLNSTNDTNNEALRSLRTQAQEEAKRQLLYLPAEDSLQRLWNQRNLADDSLRSLEPWTQFSCPTTTTSVAVSATSGSESDVMSSSRDVSQ